NDILIEVERQLIALKRQAAKVNRYRRLREQMRRHWRFIFTAEFERIQRSLKENDTELERAIAHEQSLSGAFAELESKQRKALAEVRAREMRLEQARSTVTTLEMEIDRTRNQITHHREQQQEIDLRIADLQRE